MRVKWKILFYTDFKAKKEVQAIHKVPVTESLSDEEKLLEMFKLMPQEMKQKLLSIC